MLNNTVLSKRSSNFLTDNSNHAALLLFVRMFYVYYVWFSFVLVTCVLVDATVWPPYGEEPVIILFMCNVKCYLVPRVIILFLSGVRNEILKGSF